MIRNFYAASGSDPTEPYLLGQASVGGKMKKRLSVFVIAGLIFFNPAHADQKFTSQLQAARQGDVQAMVDVGMAYYQGKGTLKDPFKAKCWIQKAYNHESEKARRVWEKFEMWQYSGKCDLSFDDQVLPGYTRGEVFVEPVTRMRFVRVPKACFKMGCHTAAEKCSKLEKPVHNACLDGFWVGVYEVDQGLYDMTMGFNPSRFSSSPDHPVENVSFHDAETFILKLNSMTRQTFSLPTEAEWEAACRSGGKPVNYPWDGDGWRPDANCGNCDTKGFSGQTAPVGSYYPNELGLYDMGGNVKEWCRDIYDKKAYQTHVKNNPEHKKRGAMRVVRGGSFTDNTSKLRCTARDKSIPTMKADNLGFRLVLRRN